MPPGDHVRPTTDRVREALFSAIAAWAGTAAAPTEQSLDGLAFCDLYAGSGAVGLEAASRGASRVLLVERDPRMAQLSRRNADALGLAVDIVGSPVEQVLRKSATQPFDVVFADPPYELDTPTVSAQIEQLVAKGWVDGGSLIVVERSRRSPKLVWPDVAAKRWTRPYGETILAFGSLDPEPGGPRGGGAMTRAVCPGSFDPVTHGHLDVIERTARVVDDVVVAVGTNISKNALFAPDERVEMLTEECAQWSNVEVTLFDGLLVDFCAAHGIDIISKGLRAADFSYELQMAQMNRKLTGVDTMFLPTAPQWAFVSSSLVREVATLGGDVTAFLPAKIAARTKARVASRNAGAAIDV